MIAPVPVHCFSITSMGCFFFRRRSRAANSAICGRIGVKLDLVQDFMIVLLTCKNKEDLTGNGGARLLTSLYLDFVRRSRAANLAVSSGIPPKFKLIQAFYCSSCYVGHPISSDNGLTSQKPLLGSELHYPLHVAMGVAYSCLKYGVFITT